MTPLSYQSQDSGQTLGEALEEYYGNNPVLLEPGVLPADVAELFRQHDAGHVIFGCDTSIRGETLIDTWTVFATTAGLRGYLQYFKHPQVNLIFSAVGYWQIFVVSVRCLPDIWRLILLSRKMSARWPWDRYHEYLGRPLRDLRAEFNIQVI